jgi:hypothetical protein
MAVDIGHNSQATVNLINNAFKMAVSLVNPMGR